MPEVNYKTGERSNLLIRITSDDGMLKRQFPCEYCGKRYTEKRYLLNHQGRHCHKNPLSSRNRSVNVKPFQCATCGSAFSRQPDLVQHSKRDCGRTTECSICGRTFSQRSSFYKHKRSHCDQNRRLNTSFIS